MTTIDLSENDLSELPEDLHERIPALKRLTICRNAFTLLPPSILLHRVLEVLDVSYNRIEYLPREINNMTSLTTLDVSHNPLRSVDKFNNVINFIL
jgi:Leucine-rich repeat (LRR) protein